LMQGGCFRRPQSCCHHPFTPSDPQGIPAENISLGFTSF